MKNTNTCTVTNKSAGRVIYNIKEDGLRRVFYPRETKNNVSVAELHKLVQQPGGLELLYNYLYIHEPNIAREVIIGEIAPEYWITEEQLPGWMMNCSLPEFQDALDFAPDGTKDLIKKYAVSLPLNDYSKRQAIKEQLGFDVTVVLANSEEEKEKTAKPAGRRATSSITPQAEEDTPKRRVVISSN